MFLALKFVDLITVIHWVYTPEATHPVISAGLEWSESTILNYISNINILHALHLIKWHSTLISSDQGEEFVTKYLKLSMNLQRTRTKVENHPLLYTNCISECDT